MKKPKPNPSAIRVWCPSENICVIDPGFVNLGTNPTQVNWKNDTSAKIDVFFPSHGVSGNVRHLEIQPGDTKGTNTMRVSNGDYPYAVYCHQCGSFAYAGSEPEMIVP